MWRRRQLKFGGADAAGSSAGFSLVEAMVAAVIATVAVIGLAHTFSLGRSFINRFEIARAALGVAQQRLELLHGEPVESEAFADTSHLRPFNYAGNEVGIEEWHVTWYDDPASPATSNDLKQVVVIVRWTMGGVADSLRLSRLFLP